MGNCYFYIVLNGNFGGLMSAVRGGNQTVQCNVDNACGYLAYPLLSDRSHLQWALHNLIFWHLAY